MKEVFGKEAEVTGQLHSTGRKHHRGQQQGKKRAQVEKHQPAGGAAEVGE
jgi:hypothetical protein